MIQTLSTRAFKYLRKINKESGLQNTDEEIHDIGIRLLDLCHVATEVKGREEKALQNLLTEGEIKALYSDQKFAREDKTSFGWLAIKKTPVSNSTSKNWNEQNKLLSALEKLPNAAEMSWFITTYFEVRGVRLFESIYVRTSSLGSGGGRVRVGCFGAKGLGVGRWSDDYRSDNVGLSAARKQ